MIEQGDEIARGQGEGVVRGRGNPGILGIELDPDGSELPGGIIVRADGELRLEGDVSVSVRQGHRFQSRLQPRWYQVHEIRHH